MIRISLIAALALATAATPALAQRAAPQAESPSLGAPAAQDWRTPNPDDVMVIDTNKGVVFVELSPAIAPTHVERIKTLTRQGFYDGRSFFRVIDVPIGVCLSRVVPPERLRVLHLETVRPYRPLPLFRADTLVQHYMQPEEFKQFHARALAAAAESAAGAKGGGGKDGASAGGGGGIPAEVYDLFVKAKVMRR